MEVSKAEGEKGLNHHGTRGRIMNLLLQREGAVCSRRMSLESSVLIMGEGGGVPLSELHREDM